MGRVHGDLLVSGFVLSMPTHNTREGIEEKLVKHLVDRFCGWHLPKDFHPDGGIMFMDVYDNGTEQGGKFEPTGTNLFTAEQAKEMFRFLLEHENGTPILAEILHQELQKAREEERERIKTTIETLLLDVQPLPEDADTFMGEHEKTVVQTGYMVKEWVMEAFKEPDQSELDQPTI